MDIKQIHLEVIPHLEKLFFPTLLLGEEISYTKDEFGYWTRSNKDKSPDDYDYIPNRIINISPSENLSRIKTYFELSYFTPKQLEFIFSQLDKSLIKFNQIPLEKFISYDNSNIKFKLFEKDLSSKKSELIENYNEFKKSIETPSRKKSELKIKNSGFTFKIKAGASKKRKASELFEILAKDNYIDLASKSDFIDAFIGNYPKNKINWIGAFGDLKSFINYTISENLIEKVSAKWIYTANLFMCKGFEINNNSLNDAKKTVNDLSVKKIVKSIL
ncbi:hypothetical protein [Flavobacterium sp.]|jgi:hypothetical protein|uniref:hypothetical protein n=1 Tax=Flavobacterium sp. TaxID=239 RepID=UPI0037BE4A49